MQSNVNVSGIIYSSVSIKGMLDKRTIVIILHHYKFPRELFHISEQFSIFHEVRWNINSNAKQVSKKNGRGLSPASTLPPPREEEGFNKKSCLNRDYKTLIS